MSISAGAAARSSGRSARSTCSTPRATRASSPTRSARCASASRPCSSSTRVMGVEVHTTRLWQRAAELDLARLVFVNMLDRERADFFRTLESLKAAFGPHVVATEIPIGSEHEVSRRDRPRRHEGLRVRRRRARENCSEIPIPDELQAERAQEYREKLMDEVVRDLRRADGALPRGRGDLPRGDRHRAQGRHQPRLAVPGHLRRRHAQPRPPTACSTRSSRTCPRRSSTAGWRSAR